VWIDIPLDVQSAVIDESKLNGYAPAEQVDSGDRKQLEKQVGAAIDLLNRSERPVILAGNGVRLGQPSMNSSPCWMPLRVPVLTTWKTADILPDDHPFYIGRPGSVGQRAANFAQQNSDWILVLGHASTWGRRATIIAILPQRQRRSL